MPHIKMKINDNVTGLMNQSLVSIWMIISELDYTKQFTKLIRGSQRTKAHDRLVYVYLRSVHVIIKK